MIVLNSENFNDEEIKYLKFSNDFNIEILKKIKIILGPNGIGKDGSDINSLTEI